MSSRSRWYPYLALAAAVLVLSLSSLFVRWADAPGTVTSFYRMTIGAAAFLPLFLRQSPAQRRIEWRWLFLPVLAGIFSAVDHGTWATAINHTRVANATLINNMAPLWVALIALVFWRERLKAGFWVGLALALGGAAVVLGGDFLLRPQLNYGNLLAIASSLFFALYYLVSQRGREHFNALTFAFLVTVTSSLALLAFVLADGQPLSGFSTRTYLTFLAAGLVSQVIGYFSVAYALGHLPASVVSSTMIAQPVLTALLAIPLAGEPLLPTQWAGGLIVLAGIYWINRTRA